jgi:hypothetical protein
MKRNLSEEPPFKAKGTLGSGTVQINGVRYAPSCL